MCEVRNKDIVLEYRLNKLTQLKLLRYLILFMALLFWVYGLYVLEVVIIICLKKLNIIINSHAAFCDYISSLTQYAEVSAVVDDYVMINSFGVFFPFKGVMKDGRHFVLDCLNLTYEEVAQEVQ